MLEPLKTLLDVTAAVYLSSGKPTVKAIKELISKGALDASHWPSTYVRLALKLFESCLKRVHGEEVHHCRTSPGSGSLRRLFCGPSVADAVIRMRKSHSDRKRLCQSRNKDDCHGAHVFFRPSLTVNISDAVCIFGSSIPRHHLGRSKDVTYPWALGNNQAD